MSQSDNFDWTLIKEYNDLCVNNKWNSLFQRIKNNSTTMAQLECNIARSAENRFKNTFREVVAYDFNRVTLTRKNKTDSDYINGSNITLHGRSYIVTQYPDMRTAHLFWSMVWQSQSPGVIMLCKQCDDETSNYFPKLNEELIVREAMDNDSEKMYVIYTESELFYDGFVQRKLRIDNVETNERRELWHFEFWSWPDHGIPQCMESFLTLLGVTRQLNIVDSVIGPPIIHCSAGAGRSGTFCLIDIALLLVERQGHLGNVNVPGLMEGLRCQRMGMVHSFVQLKFCYEAVIEAFKRYNCDKDFKSDGSYLLVDNDGHMCVNSVVKAPSSMSSDDTGSDVVMYIQLSEESDVINDDDDDSSQDLSPRNLLNERNDQHSTKEISDLSLATGAELESHRLYRQQMLNRRKSRNQEEVAILMKHLEENRLKRYRIISVVASSSSALLEGRNNDYLRSWIVAAGAVLFMGTYCWLKYSHFRCS